MRSLFTSLFCLLALSGFAQSKYDNVDKFRQLEEILPTPNVYRTASGAPGHAYWQQQADVHMKLRLDDAKQHLYGSQTITYTNNSPDTLKYIWMQLDQNRFRPDSDDFMAKPAPEFDERDEEGTEIAIRSFRRYLYANDFTGGYNITAVKDKDGKDLDHTINKTMMRIEMPKPLKNGDTVTFQVDWDYQIPEQHGTGARGGWEYFAKDDNYLYEMAQFYPRMVAYTDVNGWHNKQFLGRGEFTLDFGDFKAEITVPADHIVASTGTLQNPDDVLTKTMKNRLEEAKRAKKPVMVVSQDEAIKNEKSRSKKTKTWIYHAENVRDFAWASSRKFIWDAQEHTQEDGSKVMAMSYYPKEGNPLWERYSTAAIIHTLEEYNKYTFIYPYPVAISVNGPVGGMEYPMICFNGPRPEEDGTYSRRTKYGLITVIIHEVGHNYFPMIVNSDERQWTWMDEGLNTFVQFLAEQHWEENYPSWRGEPSNIVDYMISENQVPIMTNSESVLQFGNNAYGKPATALNILRETIMGRELFDYAFREYSQRWMFKRPQPADFFRTMEDASGVDLDWFWRGWFYSTDHVDISLDKITLLRHEYYDGKKEMDTRRKEYQEQPVFIGKTRNKDVHTKIEKQKHLSDFYNEHDKFTATPMHDEDNDDLREALTDEERPLMEDRRLFYKVDFSNIGGLVMPIILKIDYADGSHEIKRIPAEIWRYNHEHVSKLFVTEKEITGISVDPFVETADADMSNNDWPRKITKSRFRIYKDKQKNLMQKLHGDDASDK